jgi:hypothetical protein
VKGAKVDFIEQPNIPTRTKEEKPKGQTKYKVKAWVEDLSKTPNRWAIYSRKPLTRDGMKSAYSALDGYRRRYPQCEWAISREEDCYAICARYLPTATEGE